MPNTDFCLLGYNFYIDKTIFHIPYVPTPHARLRTLNDSRDYFVRPYNETYTITSSYLFKYNHIYINPALCVTDTVQLKNASRLEIWIG